MSINFGGVGSGLPVNDWIDMLMQIERRPIDSLYTKKSSLQTAKSTLNTVEGKVSSLRTYIEKLTDANLASSFDLFAKKSATSADTSMITATATNQAATQSVSIKVAQLATATVAKTLDSVQAAKLVTGSELITDLGDKQGTTGTFSLYTNGVKHEFEIDATSTLDSVVQDINDAGIGVTAFLETAAGPNQGKLQLSYDNTVVTSFSMGSSSDSSNFLNIAQLSTATPVTVGNTVTYSSINQLNSVNTSGTITSTANLTQAVTAGTFTIGEETFEIDNDTTLSDLIGQINSSEDAGVVARFDTRLNKLVLTSKDPGKVAINLEDSTNDPANNTSNFLTAMGLVTAGGDSLSSQTLGKNAEFYLNGSTTAQYATSNTLTSDITGIAGLTMNLVKETDGDFINVNVAQDTSQLVSAVNDFISKFNDIQNEVTRTTSSTGNLKSDYTLVRFKNDLRQTVTSGVSGLSDFDSLAMIGITTGAVGTSAQTSTTNLQLDTSKFLAALQENPSEVKALLVGDSSQGITGILQTLETKVESALDPTSGYFAARENSMNTTITDIDRSIKRGELRLEAVRQRLVNQFSAMDRIISQMQQQGSSLSMLGI